MRILIVDDEDLARARLKSLLSQCGELRIETVGEARDAAHALNWLREHSADVVLLDVQMPGLNGIRFAQQLRQQHPELSVIFITAHAEYAVEAFGLEAVDYLTKPIKLERLKEALGRAQRRRFERQENQDVALDNSNSITVSDRGRMLRVALTEIIYLKAELKYVTLRTAQRSFVLDDSLTELEQRLGAQFVRVHRNALVAKRAMRELQRRHDEEEGMEGWAVRVSPTDEWLAVSRRQAAAVKEAIAQG